MSIEPPPVCDPVGQSWYVNQGDTAVHGPYTFDALLEAARLGHIAATTSISHPDFTGGEWMPALNLPEIAAVAIVPSAATASTQTRSGQPCPPNQFAAVRPTESERDRPVMPDVVLRAIVRRSAILGVLLAIVLTIAAASGQYWPIFGGALNGIAHPGSPMRNHFMLHHFIAGGCTWLVIVDVDRL